jgi:hypothetical protein
MVIGCVLNDRLQKAQSIVSLGRYHFLENLALKIAGGRIKFVAKEVP